MMFSREIGLTAALSSIAGIDKKVRPYKDNSRLGHDPVKSKKLGGGTF